MIYILTIIYYRLIMMLLKRSKKDEVPLDVGSKKAITEASKTKIQISSKRTDYGITPRITRRMNKLSSSSQQAPDKCAICLNDFEGEFGILECEHQFCLDCMVKWWRSHSTCPYCRKEILFIRTSMGKIVHFCDLPPEKPDLNAKFIPHCELCWGQIENHEGKNICTTCRSVYWHSRCLPYSSYRWFCAECAGPIDEEQQGT